MDNITEFFAVFLNLIADFLGREPIIYVFSLVLLLFVVKILRRLLPP